LWQYLHRGEQAERDRQVEMAAFLQHIGRREVDGDMARRQRQTERRQRRPHPLARLGHRFVRQADNGKRRQPRGDRHLGLDVDDVDAVKRNRANARHHA